MTKKQTVNLYEMELLDLWNEVGGQMVIEYHRALPPVKHPTFPSRLQRARP